MPAIGVADVASTSVAITSRSDSGESGYHESIMIRIGIVGCGRILAAHLRAYRLLREAGIDDFRIAALCARKEPDAWMYVRRGEGPPQRPAVSNLPGDPLAVGDEYLSDFQDDVDVQVYTDYRQMIAEGPVDAVNDFTLHTLHHDIARVAFDNGKHLLTQKPLAVTIAAARQMCEHAEAKSLVFGVFENARHNPPNRRLHWLFHDSEHCGQLQMALIGVIGAWWAPNKIVAETPWRHFQKDAGGITLDIGVHQANALRYIAGEITRVTGRVAVLEPKRCTFDAGGNLVEQIDCDADDTFFANFETDQNVVGSITSSWGGHGEKTLLGTGTVYYGTGGKVTGNDVVMDGNRNANLAELYESESTPQRQAADFPHGIADQFALNHHDWLEAIRTTRQPETSGREGLRDLAVAYAILESSHAGRTVDVEEVYNGQLRETQKSLDERFGMRP